MPKTKKNRASFAPFSLRLSQEERERLERDAGDMPRSAYIRSCLFDETTPRKRRLKNPVKDHKILAQALALLGQSRIASNLNQIAKALNSGSLIISPDTEDVIREACAAIIQIRDLLMKALDMRGNDHDS
ncbi:MAG: plasmid mobilization relaxosome protein MobC [Alphaproteobacteria bacterium]